MIRLKEEFSSSVLAGPSLVLQADKCISMMCEQSPVPVKRKHCLLFQRPCKISIVIKYVNIFSLFEFS